MDEAEADVHAYMSFPKEHWVKIHSTNSLERLNGEVKRRTEVVGISPIEEAIPASSAPCSWNRMTTGSSSAPAT